MVSIPIMTTLLVATCMSGIHVIYDLHIVHYLVQEE